MDGAGWISGWQAIIALWVWLGIVVVHGLFWRSLDQAVPDPIRPSGPIR